MSGQQLDSTTVLVLGALLDGLDQGVDMHGWRIMQHTGRSGPRVYGSLDRLEEWGWVETWWETLRPGESRPRKRFYRLAADRVEAARSAVDIRLRKGRPTLRPRFGFLAVPPALQRTARPAPPRAALPRTAPPRTALLRTALLRTALLRAARPAGLGVTPPADLR
jgi:PadR family transcriptional regulator PadR